MNKNSINNVVEFMVKVLIVAGIVIGVILSISIVLFIKNEKKNLITKSDSIKTQKEYPAAVGTYLEEKYGKKFIVNPKGSDGGGSPIPFSQGCYTMTYEAYAEEDSDFIFCVDVIPRSIDNSDIREIRDSYCWKFLRTKLRRKLEEKLNETLADEYKVYISIYGGTTFESYVMQDSKIEDYFRSSRIQPRISICVFVSENNKSTELKVEKDMDQLLIALKGNNNVNIDFIYYVTKSKKEFEYIDVKNEERKDFIVYKSNYPEVYKRSIWSIEMDEKFEIKIDTNDI